MTRKHFIAIAADIHLSVVTASNQPGLEAKIAVDRLYVLTCDLAATFSTFNSNFNRTQFLTACGF